MPIWLGSNHPNLIVLLLRSNRYFGSIASHLCHLTYLKVLDLALNQILGSIPICLKNIIGLTQKWTPNSTITHSYNYTISLDSSAISRYDDHAIWIWKGREYEYKSILGLVKSIDLSSNKLIEEIPREIMELNGLISLNLSRNLLTGRIPLDIGLLESLNSLDLSKNHLCGGIPSSISQINSLSFLNLSNNNLSGEIPTGPQLNTFSATSYEMKPNLCGFPLPNKCLGEEMTQNSIENRGSEHASIQEEEDEFITVGFYVSMALGVVVGFRGVFGTLLLNKSCRFSYFKFLDIVKDKIYVTGAVNMNKLRRRLQT
ncbi:receptor-like protein EIX2 [Quercus suber]